MLSSKKIGSPTSSGGEGHDDSQIVVIATPRLKTWATHTYCLLILSLCGAAPVHTQPAGAPASQPTSKPVPFQPGIEIDWGRREVRAKATVIMREGLIELFACSPQEREHESIVRMEAQPLHLYHALGMIGLTPGHPIRLNPDTQKEEMATGDPVEIEVRYESAGQVRQEPIERWMKLSGKGDRLEPLPWVFAGSSQVDGGGIAADSEGTVIALVDFGSSLIALPEHHTDQNDALWLVPATENIPPADTSCTLIIRAGPMRINMDAAGRLTIDGRKSNALELSRAVKTRAQDNPELKIQLQIHPDCSQPQQRGLRQLLIGLGVQPNNISTTRPATEDR